MKVGLDLHRPVIAQVNCGLPATGEPTHHQRTSVQTG